jgi:hypothetical protein
MTVRASLAVLALLSGITGATAVAGCGAASSPSPPAGVDGLVVPTPSPDPDDFVAGVDNPWFPLQPDTTWRYDVADLGGTYRLTVTVADGPTVAGVATTARVSTEAGRTVADYYAQDNDGNVWWFGRQGSWRAGVDGAEAGLAMPATPRVGDGYREAYARGVVEDVAEVSALEERMTVPVGTFEALVVEHRSALAVGTTRETSYAEGLGVVAESVVAGAYRTVRLVGITPLR